MKLLSLTLFPLLATTAAFAHEGHAAPVAGHAHWELAIVPLAAIAVGLLFWQLKLRNTSK